jgi:hypothetical protein
VGARAVEVVIGVKLGLRSVPVAAAHVSFMLQREVAAKCGASKVKVRAIRLNILALRSGFGW